MGWYGWMACCLLFIIDPVFAAKSWHHPEADYLLSVIRQIHPIDFCGETVPIDRPDIRERLEKELLLMLGDPAQVILWLKRFQSYDERIRGSLKEAGLPEDLKFIPVIESALLPDAGSAKGAMGQWQFMPETGKRYGLALDTHIDQRKNPEISARAAFEYLRFLFTEFQSWTLAAAAYNMGEDGLKSEIFLQETRDFYQLDLYPETERYVLRIAAAKMIITRAREFGFHLETDDFYTKPPTVRVDLDLPAPLTVLALARAAQTSVLAIRDLNPQIRGYILPSGLHSLEIPDTSATDFRDRLDQIIHTIQSDPAKPTYTVEKGDNLSSISQKLGIPLRALMVINKLDSRSVIHPGDRLLLSPLVFRE